MKTLRDRFPLLSYWAGKKLMLLNTFFYRKNPVKWSLKTYKRKFGVKLNLKNPTLFYEKINYWKHYAYNNKQDALTDKLVVKDILTKDGYKDLVAKCYFKTDNVNEFKRWFSNNSDKYNSFVIKTNHGCGDVFIYNKGEIVKKNGRKIKRINTVFKMLKISLKHNHYYSRFELNYKNIKPMIYVEEYIDFSGRDTKEYEIMTNYGKIRYANIVFDRQVFGGTTIIVDEHFNYLETDSGVVDKKMLDNISAPRNLELIKEIIAKYCSEFPFCRVDFIETSKKLYFVEFTFVKSGGINRYKPDYLNAKLGELFEL